MRKTIYTFQKVEGYWETAPCRWRGAGKEIMTKGKKNSIEKAERISVRVFMMKCTKHSNILGSLSPPHSILDCVRIPMLFCEPYELDLTLAWIHSCWICLMLLHSFYCCTCHTAHWTIVHPLNRQWQESEGGVWPSLYNVLEYIACCSACGLRRLTDRRCEILDAGILSK